MLKRNLSLESASNIKLPV